ncbi:hypothetical protein [Niveispirillum fermenti]|uniref:hypothetical protein n=1 Tax=Niveispirillum fermenti TaxID=1233113 RepID=UPI003A8835D5
MLYAPANTYDGRGTWVITRADDQFHGTLEKRLAAMRTVVDFMKGLANCAGGSRRTISSASCCAPG